MPDLKGNCRKQTATWLLVFMVLVAVFIFLPQAALAQASLGLELGADTGLGTRDLKDLIVTIIRVLFGFLGIIAVILMIYAGYLWLTSQGDEQKISQAKKILLNSAVGLAIILSAYGIVIFIVKQFEEGGIFNPGGPGRDQGVEVGGGEALGGGILRDIYPEPGQRDVPRNTLIMVTFKEAMDLNTLVDLDQGHRPPDCQGVPENTTCGFLKADANSRPTVRITNSDQSETLAADQVVVMTNDRKSFVFNPRPLLGSEASATNYAVNLSEQIAKASGGRAFLSGGYTWRFQVSNFSDLTPPQVESFVPANQEEVKRNIVVQINFNEAMNVVTATGQASGNPDEPLNTILLSYLDNQGDMRYLTGEAVISNRFRTVEFISDQPCLIDGQPVEENSCGLRPTCFPADELVIITLKAAVVNENGETVDLFSGLTDSAGNSLDGNQNGEANGQPDDNQNSSFTTTDELDLMPPQILSVSPEKDANLVAKNSRVSAEFNERLMSSTLNSEYYRIFKFACNGNDFPAELACYPEGGFNIYKENIALRTRAILRTFYPYLDPLTVYNPRLTAGIKDLYQNCFKPAVGP